MPLRSLRHGLPRLVKDGGRGGLRSPPQAQGVSTLHHQRACVERSCSAGRAAWKQRGGTGRSTVMQMRLCVIVVAKVVVYVSFQFTKLVCMITRVCNNKSPICQCRRIAGMLAGEQQRGQQQLRAASSPGKSSDDFVCRRTVDDEGQTRQVHDYED